jgi:branched-chain amino acid transport system permease protein
VTLLVISRIVAQNWVDYTNGSAGLTSIPASFGAWEVGVWAAAAVVLAFSYQRSRNGLRLRTSREDEIAARSIGVRVELERGIAFAISGFIVGTGGALFVQSTGAINPDAFYIQITFLTITMLVVGGSNSLAGAVLGTLTIAAVSEVLRHAERGNVFGLSVPARPGLREVGLGLVMLVILIRRPGGLMGDTEFALRRPRHSVRS